LRFCHACGSEIAEGTKFCGKCGAKQEPTPSGHTAAPPTRNRKKLSSKRKAFIGATAVLLVAAIIVTSTVARYTRNVTGSAVRIRINNGSVDIGGESAVEVTVRPETTSTEDDLITERFKQAIRDQ
jgi:hypothetical protein